MPKEVTDQAQAGATVTADDAGGELDVLAGIPGGDEPAAANAAESAGAAAGEGEAAGGEALPDGAGADGKPPHWDQHLQAVNQEMANLRRQMGAMADAFTRAQAGGQAAVAAQAQAAPAQDDLPADTLADLDGLIGTENLDAFEGLPKGLKAMKGALQRRDAQITQLSTQLKTVSGELAQMRQANETARVDRYWNVDFPREHPNVPVARGQEIFAKYFTMYRNAGQDPTTAAMNAKVPYDVELATIEAAAPPVARPAPGSSNGSTNRPAAAPAATARPATPGATPRPTARGGNRQPAASDPLDGMTRGDLARIAQQM